MYLQKLQVGKTKASRTNDISISVFVHHGLYYVVYDYYIAPT